MRCTRPSCSLTYKLVSPARTANATGLASLATGMSAGAASGLALEVDDDDGGAVNVESVGGVVDDCTGGSPLCVPTSSLRFFRMTNTTAIATTTATTIPPRIRR